MRSRFLSLLLLLLPAAAHAWTVTSGYSDVWISGQGGGAPLYISIPAAGCVNTTPGSAWDLFATDPVAACIPGTSHQEGVLNFDATNTCTSTSATVGCAFYSYALPADFPSAGRITATLMFKDITGGDFTAGHTVIWNISTQCTAPLASGANRDNAGTMNAAQAFPTFSNGASEAAFSLHTVTLASDVTTTGCAGGSILHIRIGRDISDTVTTAVSFAQLQLTIYVNR